MSKQIKILLVDDHQLVLDGLKLILEDQEGIKVIGSCYNGKSAVEFIKDGEVDLVLMDLNMPEMNGIEASKQILKIRPDIKVLILSMLSDTQLIRSLVKDGIHGYLLKNSGQEEIVNAIQLVAAGKNYFDPRITEILLGTKEKKQVKTEQLFPSLSRREKEILQLIVDQMTTKEIAEKLFISVGTVESHRRNMISKLGVRNVAGLVSACYKYDLLA